MQDIQHTPGPWHCGVDQRGRERVFAPNGKPVVAAHYGSYGEFRKARAANARLIAAAPDLLAALQNILDDSDGLSESQFQMAAFAVAKARGQ